MVAGSATSARLSSLALNTTSYWQVRAVNSTGVTDANSGAWYRFTTAPASPSTFAKLNPADHAGNVSLDPILYWSPEAGDNMAYEYCLDADTNTTCDSGWMPAGTGASIHARHLVNDTVYSWQVRAVPNGPITYADGDAASFFQFTTLGAPPSSSDQAFTMPEDTLFSAVIAKSGPALGSVTVILYRAPTPGILTLHEDGAFTFMPPLNYNGDITFQFAVTDGLSPAVGPYTATLLITAVDDPPVLISVSPMTIISGQTVTFTAEATDPDVPYGDHLTYALSGSVPAGAGIDPTTGVFSWKAPSVVQPQTVTFTLIVTDKDTPQNQATQQVSITVSPYSIALPAVFRP